MSFASIGKRVPRHDAALQVTGELKFGADLEFPGMLHGYILRSPLPHARILEIDTSAARGAPGVAAVITHRDVPHNRWGFTHQDQPVLADDAVRYAGDPVAVVAATSLELARDAAGLIKVSYEPLPAVFDPIEAMKPDAPRVHGESNVASRVKIRHGDVEAGFREADVIVEETYRTQNTEHCHIEPHVATALCEPTGKLTVWTGVQRPFLVASDLSKILKIPQNRLRVVVAAVGGGFGGKNEISVEPYAALLAIMTGRPVRVAYTREEEFTASTVRHAYIMKYKTGVKKDGTLVARQVTIISDSGAYVSWGASTLTKAAIHAAGPYVIPSVRIDGYLVYTNKVVGGAMRGFGVPQVTYAYECHTDSVAAKVGMDPLEFRLKNGFRKGSVMPTGQVLESVRLIETLNAAAEMAGWRGRDEG